MNNFFKARKQQKRYCTVFHHVQKPTQKKQHKVQLTFQDAKHDDIHGHIF
jgi:hypothetical protein